MLCLDDNAAGFSRRTIPNLTNEQDTVLGILDPLGNSKGIASTGLSAASGREALRTKHFVFSTLRLTGRAASSPGMIRMSLNTTATPILRSGPGMGHWSPMPLTSPAIPHPLSGFLPSLHRSLAKTVISFTNTIPTAALPHRGIPGKTLSSAASHSGRRDRAGHLGLVAAFRTLPGCRFHQAALPVAHQTSG